MGANSGAYALTPLPGAVAGRRCVRRPRWRALARAAAMRGARWRRMAVESAAAALHARRAARQRQVRVMLRTFLADRRHSDHPDFTWRGTDVSRLEGFSDGVFGFAVTLLVV